MNLPPDPRFYRRFWSYVDQGDPSTCWPWRAAVDRQGYGWFTWPGHGHRRQKYRAHRVALALVESPNSDELLCLCVRRARLLQPESPSLGHRSG